MKDEIKEILDYLKMVVIEKKQDYFELGYSNSKILLDYIINLREELRLERAKNKSLLNTTYGIKNTKWKNKGYDLQVELNATLKNYGNLVKEWKILHEENERLKDLYRKTCNHLFNIGNDELARYFQAQINECNTFTTQGVDNE